MSAPGRYYRTTGSRSTMAPPFLPLGLVANILILCTLLKNVSSFSFWRDWAFVSPDRRYVGAVTSKLDAVESTKGTDNVGQFRAFENSVTSRIKDADETSRCAIDPAGMFNDLMSAPMITFAEIMRLSSAKNDDNMKQDRNKLVEMMNQSGGYIIVKLGGAEAQAMNNMWDCVNNLFGPSEQTNLEAPMRHQSLTRDESDHGGYDYLETTVNRATGDLDPEGLSVFGEDHYHHCLNSYRLLENLGEDVAAILAASTAGVSPRKSRELIHKISDDGSDIGFGEESPVSCSVHRFCRYAAATNDEHIEEIMRSHTDWTLATVVPIAQVPGLEVWQPSEKSWIRPELTAKWHWETRLHFPGADDVLSWNSRYVAVLAGKWLEILTDGGVQAAIHRVVSVDKEPRMSAPFFLRPRQAVPLGVQRHFGEAHADENAMNDKDGATSMQQYLKDLAP